MDFANREGMCALMTRAARALSTARGKNFRNLLDTWVAIFDREKDKTANLIHRARA